MKKLIRKPQYYIYIIAISFIGVFLLIPSHDIILDTQAGNVLFNPPIPTEMNLCQLHPGALDQNVQNKEKQIDKATPSHRNVPFGSLIVEAAGRYKVDPALIQAIIMAESGYNPKARSKRGAGGLMQLMPSTAKSLGVKDIYNPGDNIDAGVRYLKKMLDQFEGDVMLALAAYNAGSRYVKKYRGIPPFKATIHYIKKVLKYKKKYTIEKDFHPRMA